MSFSASRKKARTDERKASSCAGIAASRSASLIAPNLIPRSVSRHGASTHAPMFEKCRETLIRAVCAGFMAIYTGGRDPV